MQLQIVHHTAYHYEEAVKYTAQTLRLTPRREGAQRILSWTISAPGRRTEQLDAHGNITHLLTLEEPHRAIEIDVHGIVEMTGDEAFVRFDGTLSPLAYLAPTPLTTASPEMVALALEQLAAGGELRERLYRLAGGVYQAVRYMPGTTSVEDSAAQVFARGQGVCQDQAHVFIACCRAGGIPARYVSGYLCGLDGGDSASHAWVDAWIEDSQRWLSIDVTHLEPMGPKHCRLAVGRDYLDAAPVRGVRRGGGREVMAVSVAAIASGTQ
ncbi:MAG TPA: transglutaminase family protein [Steroidobacteraceae bacterium]|jgi:transglutaminase-like putative cysteine protease|nr:transglutaminase family protein [Steroidobacteraceae bacterium]